MHCENYYKTLKKIIFATKFVFIEKNNFNYMTLNDEF